MKPQTKEQKSETSKIETLNKELEDYVTESLSDNSSQEDRLRALREGRKQIFESNSISVALFRALKKLFEGDRENALQSNPLIQAIDSSGNINEVFRTKILNQGDRTTLVNHAITLLEKDETGNSDLIQRLKGYERPKNLDKEKEKELSILAIGYLVNYYDENAVEKEIMSENMKEYFKSHMETGKYLHNLVNKSSDQYGKKIDEEDQEIDQPLELKTTEDEAEAKVETVKERLKLRMEKIRQEKTSSESTETLTKKISDLENEQENLRQQYLKQQEELQSKANSETRQTEIESRLAEIDRTLANLNQQIWQSQAAVVPQWVNDLKLNETQIAALNKIEGFKLEQLNDLDVKETYEELKASNQALAKILADKAKEQEQAKQRIASSGNNPYIINDSKNKKVLEQLELQERPNLEKVAHTIQEMFNEHFVVSVALSSGKIKSSIGKVTSVVQCAASLISDLPFGSFVSAATSAGVSHFAQGRRAARYEKLSELIEQKDLSKGSELAEEIGRKIALTAEVKIIQDLAKKKNPQEIERYCESLAKSCLEVVLNGSVEKILSEQFPESESKKPNRSDVIKAIGLAAGLIGETHDIYEISVEKAQKISSGLSSVKTVNIDNQQLFEMILQMQKRIDDLESTVAEQSAIIAQLKKSNDRTPSKNPAVIETSKLDSKYQENTRK